MNFAVTTIGEVPLMPCHKKVKGSRKDETSKTMNGICQVLALHKYICFPIHLITSFICTFKRLFMTEDHLYNFHFGLFKGLGVVFLVTFFVGYPVLNF